MSTKKKGMLRRFFSTRKGSVEDDVPKSPKSEKGLNIHNKDHGAQIKLERSKTVEEKTRPMEEKIKPSTDHGNNGSQIPVVLEKELAQAPVGVKKRMPHRQVRIEEGAATEPSSKTIHSAEKQRKISAAAKKKMAKRKESCGIKMDPNVPIRYPCTPELILEYHKLKPFLNDNEEWLVVELNEYECLVDSEDIIKVIAKHSKFFEVDPDELWAEFFEYVESIPAYDEVINYDIWQEFRDAKYPC